MGTEGYVLFVFLLLVKVYIGKEAELFITEMDDWIDRPKPLQSCRKARLTYPRFPPLSLNSRFVLFLADSL